MAKITGSFGDDVLFGTILNDTIRGLAGNDSLYGGAGNDTIEGGDGNDFLFGQDGNDTLNGGNGNDYLGVGAGSNSIYGGDGDDSVYIDSLDPASSNLFDGGAGTDRLSLLLWNTTQSITIAFTNGTVNLPGLTAVNFETLDFSGGSGNDVVYSGSGDDFLSGGGGNDILSGAGGNDFLSDSEGDDTLLGGAGDDYLSDSYGRNVLDGGSGNDTFTINLNDSSNTFISGGTGIDVVSISGDMASQGITLSLVNNSIVLPNSLTATGVEILAFSGSNYNDTVTGGNSNDVLSGYLGNDTLSGGNGYDRIYGGDGDDVIDGGNGIDQLYGDDEYSFGLGGNDILIGDLGADQMTGGVGADQFKFVAASGSSRFVAGRAILDFSQAEADQIVLGKTMFPALQSTVGNGFSISTEFATVKSAAAAATSNALITYNINTGILYYNANGAATGFGNGGQFVTLTTKPALSTSDFVIQ